MGGMPVAVGQSSSSMAPMMQQPVPQVQSSIVQPMSLPPDLLSPVGHPDTQSLVAALQDQLDAINREIRYVRLVFEQSS